MKVKILGKTWTFERKSLKNSDHHGICHPPHSKGKKIVVDSDISGEKELRVILHELLHAADWHKEEEWVEQVSTDMARILTRLGFSRSETKLCRRQLARRIKARAAKQPRNFLDRLSPADASVLRKLKRDYQAGKLKAALADAYRALIDEGIDIGIMPGQFRFWMNEGL